MENWEKIALYLVVAAAGYLLGNLLPFSAKTEYKTMYYPYVVTDKEFRYHDSIVIHNSNITRIEKDYNTDTININTMPDSLLRKDILTNAERLLGYKFSALPGQSAQDGSDVQR